LIVGGGMTADAAVHGIREVDRDGSIGLLSAEGHPPYERPPLSKKLWKGKPLEKIWRKTESQGVTLHLGRTAQHLDPQNKRITDDQGTTYGYDKLLLATGGMPRRLPFGGEQVIYFRTLDDYTHLRDLAGQGGAVRRHRRWLYRLGNRGGPGHEWQESGDGLSRRMHRQSHVPG
jgi:NAD(P)H-nitrite reductase large subunit